MKKTLLLFAVTVIFSVPTFAQQNTQELTANFEFNWTEYLLPDCSFLIYHGKDECYFIDSLGKRVPNHSYIDIKTGGQHHFIVQDSSGFHLLDTHLKRITKKVYDGIQLCSRWELKLTSKDKSVYYSWDDNTASYQYKDGPSAPSLPSILATPSMQHLELGKVTDSRFKAKRIEQLRIGIDMSKTLTVGQKGKNVIVSKGEDIVFKGPTKPMLFYDFMITGSKGPHSVYHPISKEPLLENCDRFWFVGSFLIVSVKGSLRKHILSNTGKIILTTAGEIRYYDYEFGGTQFSFFCDGRSVINLNDVQIYRSDGELVGIGEHYIYSGNSGGYLGDLSRDIEVNCTNFERFGILTVGQTGRNKWRLFDPKSILINQFDDYYYDEIDSLLVCTEESKTIVCDPYSGYIIDAYPVRIRAQKSKVDKKSKYFTTVKEGNIQLEGRFDPKDGRVIAPKYLKIEWPKSLNYYVVVTTDGLIRYLDRDGQELFD